MKKLLLIVGLAFSTVVPLTQTACTGPQQVRTYQTLKITGEGAKATIDSAADLLAQGQITVPQFEKLQDMYDNKFQVAYSAAVSALGSSAAGAPPDVIKLAADLASLLETYRKP